MDKVTTAVILAAGLGSRIASFSKNLPKGFIPIDGISLIERSIANLLGSGIDRIIIGTGYKSHAYDNLISKYPQIETAENKEFATTGSMYTLFNLRNLVDQDFLLLESDLLYAKHGLDLLLSHKDGDIILASGLTNSGDEVFLEVDEKKNLFALSKDISQLGNIYGELTGISKISQSLFNVMKQHCLQHLAQNPMLDYEHVMSAVCTEKAIYVYKIEGYPWCEIDNAEHLERAVNHVYPLIG